MLPEKINFTEACKPLKTGIFGLYHLFQTIAEKCICTCIFSHFYETIQFERSDRKRFCDIYHIRIPNIQIIRLISGSLQTFWVLYPLKTRH